MFLLLILLTALLFLVAAIRRIIRKVRRSRRLKSNWPLVTADVFDWTVIPALGGAKSEGSARIRATLAITVNHQRHYGLLHSIGMGEYPAREFVKETNKPLEMPVRYNPKNPEEMIALPGDGDLPFEIDTTVS